MSAVLSGALIIALNVLLWSHIYFTYSSLSSVESSQLLDFNPFFESNIHAERARINYHKKKMFVFSKLNMY